MHEVPRLRRDGHVDVAEEFVEPVGPFALEHGIAGAPEHARGHRYRPAAALRRLASDDREPRLMRADVPVEAALEIPRFQEIIDPGLDVLVEGAGVVGPMAEEMAKVGPARLAGAAHQRRSPGLLMERLVPDLAEMLGSRPARADPGIGAIEEEQTAHPLRLLMRDHLRDIGADVVRDDADALEAEPVHQPQNVRRVDIRAGIGRGPVRRFLRIPEAAQIRRDHVELGREIGNAFPPDPAELGPAVEEQQGRATAFAEIMDADAVRRDVMGFQRGHTASCSEAAFSPRSAGQRNAAAGVIRRPAPDRDPRSDRRHPRGRPIDAPAPRRCPGWPCPRAKAFGASSLRDA